MYVLVHVLPSNLPLSTPCIYPCSPTPPTPTTASFHSTPATLFCSFLFYPYPSSPLYPFLPLVPPCAPYTLPSLATLIGAARSQREAARCPFTEVTWGHHLLLVFGFASGLRSDIRNLCCRSCGVAELAPYVRDLDLTAPPPISDLPAPTQAYIITYWQMMCAGRSVERLSLPHHKFWSEAGLVNKPYRLTLVYVDAKTGHGVHMETKNGQPVALGMVTDLVRLLIEEAKLPTRPCPQLGQGYCNYCIGIDGADRCHSEASTIFRFLNTPDRGVKARDYATFDRHCLVRLPAGAPRSGFEVRFVYPLSDAGPIKPNQAKQSQSKPNQDKPSQINLGQAKPTVHPRECEVFSPHDFKFCPFDPKGKLHMNPHCTIGQLMPTAMVQHVLYGPDATTVSVVAAGIDRRLSRTPRQWPGLLPILNGQVRHALTSWFASDCARDVSQGGGRRVRAGDELRWDYHILAGRVEDVLGPGSSSVLSVARTLLGKLLTVRDTVWMRNTTHHILVSYPGVTAQVRHGDGCWATILIPLQQPTHGGGTMFTSRHEPNRTFCFNDHLVIGGGLFFDGVVEHYGGENASQEARILYYIEVGDRNS